MGQRVYRVEVVLRVVGGHVREGDLQRSTVYMCRLGANIASSEVDQAAVNRLRLVTPVRRVLAEVSHEPVPSQRCTSPVNEDRGSWPAVRRQLRSGSGPIGGP